MDDNTRSKVSVPEPRDERDREMEQLRREIMETREAKAQAEKREMQAVTKLTEAEESLKQAQALAEAEEELEQVQKQIRRTTFKEALEACHELACLMTVQRDWTLSTQGSTTSVKGKACPTTLIPWDAFPSLQQEAFSEFHHACHPPNEESPRLFSPLLYMQELGKSVKRQKIWSDADLRVLHRIAIENFVTDIMLTIGEHPQYSRSLGLRQGISFESHANTLSETAEEVQAQAHINAASHSEDNTRTQSPSSTSSKRPRQQKPTNADRSCVFITEGGQQHLAWIIEYKHPHQLTNQFLEAGLRPMNLLNEVINRPLISDDEHEKVESRADYRVAAALTQTYSDMLESGVEYGCVISGEAMVFLWIREEEPNSLYYHLSQPKNEVYNAGDNFLHSQTAVGQLLSLCLMSTRSKLRSQEWRAGSVDNAQKWVADDARIMRELGEDDDGKEEVPSPAYKARSSKQNDRSPVKTRSRGKCKDDEPLLDNRDDFAGDPDDGPGDPTTPSKRGGSRAGVGRGGKRQQGTKGSASEQHQRQYCTQECLLGLVQGNALDESCPNAGLHRCGRKGRKHLLTKQQFPTLVQSQLARSLDDNVKELHKQGIRGALFEIDLVAYGYMLVAKATIDVYIPYLMHEGRIYDRLESLQGTLIPVYLGNIDLVTPWYDLGVRLTHMLLMSYAGERADKVCGKNEIATQTDRFESTIKALGVIHNDLMYYRNTLWNDQLQRIMFIDFEGARVIRRKALQELSSNRKRKHGLVEEEKEEVNDDNDAVTRARLESAVRCVK